MPCSHRRPFTRSAPRVARGLLISYIGFVFWDIIILPMLGSRTHHKLGEIGEIVVDRISTDDTTAIRSRLWQIVSQL
jgi:uncharacterized membrane protein